MSANHICLPPDYDVAGEISVPIGDYGRTEISYVKGIHPELNRFGTIAFLNGWSGGPETKVKTSGIIPIKTFFVGEQKENEDN